MRLKRGTSSSQQTVTWGSRVADSAGHPARFASPRRTTSRLVDDGHSPRERAFALDVHGVAARAGGHGWVEGHGHRHRVGQADAVLAEEPAVGLDRGRVAVDREVRERRVERAHASRCRLASRHAAPRHSSHPTISMGMPERKQMRAASGSHQMLYSAAGVTLPTVQAAPPMTTQRPTRPAMSGACEQREGDVGEGAEGHEGQARVRADGVDEARDRVAGRGRRAGRRVALVAEAVLAVEELRGVRLAQERTCRAFEDRHRGAAQLHREPRVAAGLGQAARCPRPR